MMKIIKNLFKRHEQLNISVVRCSYNDVEKWCNENGYYIGTYWFPNRQLHITSDDKQSF
jgi:hypothetical protein